MTAPTSAAQRTAHPRVRRATTAALVLLIVLLPVLLAFVRIDAPAHPGEEDRVARVLEDGAPRLSAPLGMYFGTTLPPSAVERFAIPTQRHEVVVEARLAGMLALFGISALLYVLLLLVRGRATAAIGCLALCLLPPVSEEGHVLRPEQCSTLFGLLGIVLIAGLPLMLQDRQRSVSSLLARACLLLVTSVAFGVARSCHVGAWIYLTVPAGALLLSVMLVALMFPRAVRGVSLLFWPFRAAARRYVPWMLLVVAAFSGTIAFLLGDAHAQSAADTQSTLSLLPGSPVVRVLVLVLAAAGGLRLSLGVGLRIGRLRRVRPDTIIFLYVAALVIQQFLQAPGLDRLPAAPAIACLVADGTMALAVLGLGRLAKRRRRA